MGGYNKKLSNEEVKNLKWLWRTTNPQIEWAGVITQNSKRNKGDEIIDWEPSSPTGPNIGNEDNILPADDAVVEFNQINGIKDEIIINYDKVINKTTSRLMGRREDSFYKNKKMISGEIINLPRTPNRVNICKERKLIGHITSAANNTCKSINGQIKKSYDRMAGYK